MALLPQNNLTLYLPNQNPPLPLSIALGIQHVFAMFGATVLAPLLMGFNPSTAIFFSGIATILFFAILKGRVPSYLGSSFAFITAVVAATGYSGTGANPNIGIALGGIIAAGFLYAVIGLAVSFSRGKWIEKMFPPVITGTIVAIIGLNLAHVGVQQIGTGNLNIAIGLGTVLAVCLFTIYGTPLMKRLPILLGGLLSYAASYVSANIFGLAAPIDFTHVQNSSWFGIPEFTKPEFNITAISLIAPVALVLIAENLGHIKAIGGMINQPLDKYLGKAFFADGLATMISGSGGGTGVTTYAENMGVMRITRNFSSITFVIAGLFAIFLGLSPKFGTLIQTIPGPVLGGLSFIVFGLISATACSIWQRGRDAGDVNFENTKTLLVVGVSLVMGAGDFTITIGNFVFGGIFTATLTALILYHILPKTDSSKS